MDEKFIFYMNREYWFIYGIDIGSTRNIGLYMALILFLVNGMMYEKLVILIWV
jgi:hypothetical protein